MRASLSQVKDHVALNHQSTFAPSQGDSLHHKLIAALAKHALLPSALSDSGMYCVYFPESDYGFVYLSFYFYTAYKSKSSADSAMYGESQGIVRGAGGSGLQSKAASGWNTFSELPQEVQGLRCCGW